MKIPAVIITVFFEFLFLTRWFSCQKLEDKFHYSGFDLKLRLLEAVNNDGGIPIFIVRMFHNKAVGTALDIHSHLLRYFDVLFLVNFLSPAGLFGFFCGLYYGTTVLSRKIYFSLLFLLILLPFIEITLQPDLFFPVKVISIGGPFYVFSLLGIWHFVSGKKYRTLRWIFILILSVVSILWFLVFPEEIYHFCFPK